MPIESFCLRKIPILLENLNCTLVNGVHVDACMQKKSYLQSYNQYVVSVFNLSTVITQF